MTRDTIDEELHSLMNKAPSAKQDVVYALTRIRKILEHDNAKRTYWTLTFFCDWVLHTKLSLDGARKILTALDERLGRFVPGQPETIDPDGVVGDILSFALLGKHLREFLERNDLPTVWVADHLVWNKVVMLYGELVKDTPLVMSREGYQLKYLERLVITACEPSEDIVKANPGQKFSGFRWEFTLNDGQKFKRCHTFNLPEPPPNWQTQGTKANQA